MTDVLSPSPKLQFFDNNGRPAVGYKVFTYEAGTTTKLDTYTDSGGLTANSNPIVLDYRGETAIWIPPNVSYKYVFTGPNDTDPPSAPIWTVDQLVSDQLVTLYGGVDTGSANAYQLTFVANFTAYTDGVIIYWIPSNSNTGPSTVNVNGLGAVNIVNQDGSSLRPNQIIASNVIGILYKGGSFILLNVNAVGLTPSVNVKNANYTLAISDAYNIIVHTDGSVYTYTVPLDATTNFAIGTSIEIINQSGTTLFIAPDGGVSLYPYGGFGGSSLSSGSITLNAATATYITKTAANTWSQTTVTNLGTATTFVGTVTGLTAVITGNVGVQIVGAFACLTVGSNIVGISNSTDMTLTGLPAAYRPGTTRVVPAMGMRDNGVSGIGGVASIAPGGTITLGAGINNNTSGFTAALGKGLEGGFTLFYPL